MTEGPTEPGVPRAAGPAWIVARIEALPAGSFAFVMATGIISNAFWFDGRRPLSDALFALNVAAYCALLAVMMLHALRAPAALIAELLDPRRTFSFFAFVAATDVLGAVLIAAKGAPPFLQAMRGFVGAVTLIAWAWATWWIPLLALLGICKHGSRRAPLGYSLTLWSMVFPLGMYALASWRLGRAADLAALGAVARVMAWVALAAWAATAGGLGRAMWRGWRAFRGGVKG